jgi:hypothetical protein
MNTTYFDNCRIYVSTSDKLVKLAQEGTEARDAWISKAESIMGYWEEDLAIMVCKGNLRLDGVRKPIPGEEGWRPQDSIWVPRMSTSAGKAIATKINDVGRYENRLNAWLQENGIHHHSYLTANNAQIMLLEVMVGANKKFDSFVIFVPTIADESAHQKVENELGGVEITSGEYIDKYRDHKLQVW